MHVLCGVRRDEIVERLPDCGGGFAPRPIRPTQEWRPGVCTTNQAPSDKRVHLKYSPDDVAAHCARIRDLPPEKR
jgi:hypothetical protein